MSGVAIRVGILGYGALGEYIVKSLGVGGDFVVSWIWNRSRDKCPRDLYIENPLDGVDKVDLVVEVSHPDVARKYGQAFLDAGVSFFIGSPTALADFELKPRLDKKSTLFVPVGALWGSNDISKMSARGNLVKVTVTMAKHPSHLQSVAGHVRERLDAYEKDESSKGPAVLYEGPVRQLCPLAPNNVNTMACAAIAGLGFDATVARLVADKSLEAHVVTVDVEGANGFKVSTVRTNPAKMGAVTGTATFASFVSSIIQSRQVLITGEPGGKIKIV